MSYRHHGLARNLMLARHLLYMQFGAAPESRGVVYRVWPKKATGVELVT